MATAELGFRMHFLCQVDRHYINMFEYMQCGMLAACIREWAVRQLAAQQSYQLYQPTGFRPRAVSWLAEWHALCSFEGHACSDVVCSTALGHVTLPQELQEVRAAWWWRPLVHL